MAVWGRNMSYRRIIRHPGIEKKWHNRAPASVKWTITLEDGHLSPKHVVSTNNKKVNGLFTLMANKKQIISVTIIVFFTIYYYLNCYMFRSYGHLHTKIYLLELRYWQRIRCLIGCWIGLCIFRLPCVACSLWCLPTGARDTIELVCCAFFAQDVTRNYEPPSSRSKSKQSNVPGYRYRVPGSIPGATTFSEK
jgi:hypothetical protein